MTLVSKPRSSIRSPHSSPHRHPTRSFRIPHTVVHRKKHRPLSNSSTHSLAPALPPHYRFERSPPARKRVCSSCLLKLYSFSPLFSKDSFPTFVFLCLPHQSILIAVPSYLKLHTWNATLDGNSSYHGIANVVLICLVLREQNEWCRVQYFVEKQKRKDAAGGVRTHGLSLSPRLMPRHRSSLMGRERVNHFATTAQFWWGRRAERL